MAIKNYYDLLGIQHTASQDEIKQAFRKLSMKFHPDKNEGDNFLMEMFKNINEANEVLSNPDKRREYDQRLEEVVITANAGNFSTSTTTVTFSEQQHDQVYVLWNQYLEKKKKADEAYNYMVRANQLDEPRYITIKKVLSSIVLLLLLWVFVKPMGESLATSRSSIYEFVTTGTASVYRKPNIKSDVIEELPAGSHMVLLTETNYFMKVEYKDKKGNVVQGYIRKAILKRD